MIVIIITLVCFEDLYNRRFSANNSNARVISIIDDALKNEMIIDSGDAIILGKTNERTIIVDKINNVESETSFNESAELGGFIGQYLSGITKYRTHGLVTRIFLRKSC